MAPAAARRASPRSTMAACRRDKRASWRGQRWPGDYGNLWSYNQIPYDYRQRYDLNPYDRYYYGDGYIYRVDPKTMLIQQVLSAILR